MAYADLYKSGYLLRIKLSPASSFCGVRGVWQGVDNAEYLKVSVISVAEKGKANKELIKMLAKLLGVPASKINIISGLTDHLKKIYLEIPQTKENENKIAALKVEKT